MLKKINLANSLNERMVELETPNFYKSDFSG